MALGTIRVTNSRNSPTKTVSIAQGSKPAIVTDSVALATNANRIYTEASKFKAGSYDVTATFADGTSMAALAVTVADDAEATATLR